MIKRYAFGALTILLCTIVFAVLIFPYSDLDAFFYEDQVVSKVYIKTGDIGLSLLGIPGIQATDVTIEPAAATPIRQLHLDRIVVRPLLSAILAFKPGVSTSGSGLFGGEFAASAALNAPPKELQNGFGQLDISSFHLRDISLQQVLAATQGGSGGLKIGGKLNAEIPRLMIDLLMQGSGAVAPVNPSGNLKLQVRDLGPITSVPVPLMGDLEIPPLKLSESNVSVDIKKTRMLISNSSIGSDKDPIRGKVLGDFGLTMSPLGVSFGSFTYCAELTISDAYLSSLKAQFGDQLFELLQTNLLAKFKREASGPGFHIGVKQAGGDLMRALRNELSANEVPQPGTCASFEASK